VKNYVINEILQLKFFCLIERSFLQIKGTKASWTAGSSYPLKNKKTSENILPNIPINEESDIIDEDSLLTEEDLDKPQLPIGKYRVLVYTQLQY
jgi:hypothetical protein